MSVVKLGQSETYSLVGGIGQLWQQDEVTLALIIGAFSLVFPLVKNLLLLAATTTLLPLTPAHRFTLHALTAKTAKYSMLDVFVVAVLVVVVKLGKSTEVEVRSGTFMFCLAIALSMAASACVRIGSRMSTDVPEAIAAPKSRGSRAVLVLAALAAIALVVGLVLTLEAGEGQVEMIRVTKHSMLPESLVGTPDYYLLIGTSDKKSIETEVYSDLPIGNGLDFKLAKPLELEEITHIELMDKDLASDDIEDRVDVRQRVCRGQDYQFELMGPGSPRRTAGYSTLGSGASLLVLAAILWVRRHAV